MAWSLVFLEVARSLFFKSTTGFNYNQCFNVLFAKKFNISTYIMIYIEAHNQTFLEGVLNLAWLQK